MSDIQFPPENNATLRDVSTPTRARSEHAISSIDSPKSAVAQHASQPSSLSFKLKCRQILNRDLEAVVLLLSRGFPERDHVYWRRGLDRQARAAVPCGFPRYGYLIEYCGTPVGVVLLVCSRVGVDEGTSVRCNLSSWYVEPPFRCYASMLIAAATKIDNVTYLNISPSPYTWATIEAQGFRSYCHGQFFSIPILSKPAARIEIYDSTSPLAGSLPVSERSLLIRHQAYGCLSLVLKAPDGTHPFVLMPFRLSIGRMRLPCMHLIYCRDISQFVRFAGSLGRHLLRFSSVFVAIDANAPIRGLKGFYRSKSRMYFKGPDEPRCCGNLEDTERVIYGP